MINSIIIFSAKYLYLAIVVISGFYFLKQSRARQKQMAIFAAVALPFMYVVAKIAGFFYYDPRPFVVGRFMPLISHASDNGFPSDHMLFASAIASIIFVYNKKLGAAAWIIAFTVGASRILAGVHHWIDIVGSAAIAAGAAWFVKKYLASRLNF